MTLLLCNWSFFLSRRRAKDELLSVITLMQYVLRRVSGTTSKSSMAADETSEITGYLLLYFTVYLYIQEVH